MKKVRDNSSGPAGGAWRWRDTETGYLITHSNYRGLRHEVIKFLKANNRPIGIAFDEQFEENICANMPPQVCMEFIPPTMLEKMGTLAKALYQVARHAKEPLVSAEELQRRREICADCNFFGHSQSLIKVACRRCGCSGLKLVLTSSQCPLNPPKW